METTNIYILIDPITNLVRYVGKANNISQRYKAHLNRARNHQIHKKRWIASLRSKGLKPIIEVIDVVPIDEWVFWESYWIGQFKAWGFNLINYTYGGDGSTFANQTSFKKGNKAWNDTNTFINCKQCGVPFKICPANEEHKSYCSMKCYGESKKGINISPATNFKEGHIPWNKGIKGYSLSTKGRKHTEEAKRKMSESLKGRESKKKRKIKQMDKNRNLIKEFESITEATQVTGIKGISNALIGRAKSAGGFLWE